MTINDVPPPLVLQQLIRGFQVTQCISIAAKLGIADLLKDGPMSSEELAQATATHAPSLYRVLRLLTAVDLFTEGEGHQFALTPLGASLQTDIPGSVRNMALFFGDTATWQIWGNLLHSVQTGEPAYQHVFGLPGWDYRAQHPETAAIFDQFMTESTASVARTVAAAYDFSATSTLVDVGGGHGQMLASILQAYPTLQGVLFDLPHVVKGASPLLERAIAILARCHQAMKPQGKVLLVERVILTEGIPEVLVLESDVHMLVGPGGKERTEAEYRSLLRAAGFELTQLIPVLTTYYIIEAVRV
jgi:O-methyltransferase domain/Dimerisation domain